MDISQIESEVFSLPVEQRASFAKRLLLSLEEPSEAEFDRLWGEESARRAAEFDAGMIQAIPGEEVAAKARSLLR
jgi:putative addiction module component (TIGR02574 family)